MHTLLGSIVAVLVASHIMFVIGRQLRKRCLWLESFHKRLAATARRFGFELVADLSLARNALRVTTKSHATNDEFVFFDFVVQQGRILQVRGPVQKLGLDSAELLQRHLASLFAADAFGPLQQAALTGSPLKLGLRCANQEVPALVYVRPHHRPDCHVYYVLPLLELPNDA